MKLVKKFIFLKQILRPQKIYHLILKECQTFLGHLRLFYFPNKLTIDIGNICNLKCPLCPTGRGDQSAVRGWMRMEDYKKVIDEFGGLFDEVGIA